MEKIKIASKGYTVKVTSWENDGDNYKTQQIVVEDKEEALKIKKICEELFVSCNNGEGGIGNSMNGEEEHRIDEYIEENPEMKLTEIYIKELASNLLGYSEWYDYRVCEKVVVTYLEEDVYAELIK